MGGGCNPYTYGWTDPQFQARTCKYNNATPYSVPAPGGVYTGPNYFCDTPAITPLTNSRATLNAAISAMQPGGNTNILEGLTWGWRTLSPGAPFTEGKSYTAPGTTRSSS